MTKIKNDGKKINMSKFRLKIKTEIKNVMN